MTVHGTVFSCLSISQGRTDIIGRRRTATVSAVTQQFATCKVDRRETGEARGQEIGGRLGRSSGTTGREMLALEICLLFREGAGRDGSEAGGSGSTSMRPPTEGQWMSGEL